jgi:hypothetical protein
VVVFCVRAAPLNGRRYAARMLEFLRRRKTPTTSSRAAGVYLHPEGIILHAEHRATSGVLQSAPPVIRLAASADPGEVGHALRVVLSEYREEVAHPTDRKARSAAFLRQTGFRSWKSLEGPARCCWIAESDGQIVFTPLRNGGRRGDQKGFQPFGAAAVAVPSESSDGAVGRALMEALNRSL